MWKAASHTFKVRKGPVAPLEMQPRDRVGKETVKAFGPSLPKIAMGIGHVSPAGGPSCAITKTPKP
jgi:hypothetical protein